MLQFVLAFAGSLCAAVFFNVRKGNLVWSGLAGASGWLAYIIVLDLSGNPVPSIFAGSITVGLFSETAARFFKSPSTIFSIPGIFPLVPGIPAYETIRLLVENKLLDAAGKGLEALVCAVAIACGILFVTAVFRFFTIYIRKKSAAK